MGIIQLGEVLTFLMLSSLVIRPIVVRDVIIEMETGFSYRDVFSDPAVVRGCTPRARTAV